MCTPGTYCCNKDSPVALCCNLAPESTGGQRFGIEMTLMTCFFSQKWYGFAFFFNGIYGIYILYIFFILYISIVYIPQKCVFFSESKIPRLVWFRIGETMVILVSSPAGLGFNERSVKTNSHRRVRFSCWKLPLIIEQNWILAMYSVLPIGRCLQMLKSGEI